MTFTPPTDEPTPPNTPPPAASAAKTGDPDIDAMYDAIANAPPSDNYPSLVPKNIVRDDSVVDQAAVDKNLRGYMELDEGEISKRIESYRVNWKSWDTGNYKLRIAGITNGETSGVPGKSAPTKFTRLKFEVLESDVEDVPVGSVAEHTMWRSDPARFGKEAAAFAAVFTGLKAKPNDLADAKRVASENAKAFVAAVGTDQPWMRRELRAKASARRAAKPAAKDGKSKIPGLRGVYVDVAFSPA